MIRQFKTGDEKAIALLEKECFSSPWSENAILSSLENGTVFFLAEENGVVLGYVGLQVISPEGYVTNLAVTASARGKGLGTELAEQLDEFGKKENLEFISLEVRQSNTAAFSLYKKCGFKEVGKRKNFYTKPTEDAIIMTKEFN